MSINQKKKHKSKSGMSYHDLIKIYSKGDNEVKKVINAIHLLRTLDNLSIDELLQENDQDDLFILGQSNTYVARREVKMLNNGAVDVYFLLYNSVLVITDSLRKLAPFVNRKLAVSNYNFSRSDVLINAIAEEKCNAITGNVIDVLTTEVSNMNIEGKAYSKWIKDSIDVIGEDSIHHGTIGKFRSSRRVISDLLEIAKLKVLYDKPVAKKIAMVINDTFDADHHQLCKLISGTIKATDSTFNVIEDIVNSEQFITAYGEDTSKIIIEQLNQEDA